MFNNKKVSVVIATYNGESFIEQLLESIVIEKEVDEIIISDDMSNDKTLEIIKNYNDNRIKVILGPRKGLIKNFENALNKTSGEIIFLADQDDVWIRGRTKNMCKVLEKYDLVCGDCYVTDENLNILKNSFFDFNNSSKGKFRNILKNSYLGCCMAFNRNVLNKSLPFPNNIAMDDWWIGIIGEFFFKTIFLENKTLYFRRHSLNNSNTASKSIYSFKKKIIWRYNMIIQLIKKSFE